MNIGRPMTKTSSSWAFMERFEVPNLDDPDELYLTRWRIVQTPWCSLFLHRMDGPDSRPTLHDHPWSFVSLILRGGGYVESRLNPHDRIPRMRRVRRANVMRRDDAHYIWKLHSPQVWTLLLVGRRRRTWGYWRPVELPLGPEDRGEWSWTPFDRDVHADEFARAMRHRERGNR